MNLRPLALAGLLGCAHTRALVPHEPGARGDRARVHTTDGRLFVLRDWSRENALILGTGEQYDIDRRLVDTGRFSIAAREVAAVEESASVVGRVTLASAALVIVTAAAVALAGVCALSPDAACFGSSR